jgi:NAD(P)-dependent dehydrogenase (short-subunit alcohol dehydrogenase family)
MKEFRDRLAVITGAGSGMGRALAVQLAGEGCHLALCDVSMENLEETRAQTRAQTRVQARSEAPAAGGADELRVSLHLCDVSNEDQVLAFRDAVLSDHDTDQVNLLFNNAGIGGGGSFLLSERAEWERTFDVCWFGVYYCARAFMPHLVAAEEAHLVNTSSVNGFWASMGPERSHTAYAAAKFAVKGFSEALITDLRLNAPHVKVSVVMPGHIGTGIALNSAKVLRGHGALEMTAEEVAEARAEMLKRGLPVDNVPDDHIRAAVHQFGVDFRDKAPTSAEQAAAIILDGVRNERWRILVGDDAYRLDEMVRAEPEQAYEAEFAERMRHGRVLDGLMAD